MASPDSHFSRFLIIWLGQLLSKIGGGISAFALGIYLFEQLGSTTAYSFLLLCAFLPAVLLAPLGGVIADRYDRKRLMLISDLGSAFCVLVIIILLVINPAAYWAIYLGISACSIFVAFHSPAYKASVSDLLDEESYAKASGLIQLAEASRYLVAPAIAGVLMAKVSLSWVLMIDLITFLAGALTVGFIRKVSIRVTEQARIKDFSSSSVKSEISAGIQFILSNQIIRHLLMLTSIVTFLTGVLQVLFVPLVLSFADSTTLGTVQSVSASGMLLSSLFIAMFKTFIERCCKYLRIFS